MNEPAQATGPSRSSRSSLAAAAAVAVFGLVAALAPGGNDAGADPPPAQPGGRCWPLFGGTPQRNLVNTFDRNIPGDWEVQPGQQRNIKWSAQLGDRAFGSVVVAGGKVFIGTNNKNPRNPRDRGKASKEPLDKGILMCFREADGKFLWQAVHDKLPAGRVNDWPQQGIPSMPAVEGNRLYYVNNRCEVICADTEGFLDGTNDGVQDEKYQDSTDADVVWRYDMIKELNVFPHNLAICSPLLVGDALFVVTANGVDEGHLDLPHPEAPSFLCLNKRDGTPRWHSNLPTATLAEARKGDRAVSPRGLAARGQSVMHGQWSNPAYAEVGGKGQVIFPGGDGWLYAFEPDSGKLLWKFDCNPKNSFYVLGGRGTRSDFIATPVVWENKVYIGTGQDPEHKEGVGHLWCIDLTQATAKGAANPDHDVSPGGDDFDPKADANKGSAFVWHFGGEKRGGGRPRFVFGRTLSTCAVHEGLCYAADLDGHVYCLDATTGVAYWQHTMDSSTWASPYWVDGKVYLGNDAGEMLVFQHGMQKKLLNTIDLEEPIRGAPVAANGVLYVVTAEGHL
jgi:outer membrane protein assembly factor BamB